MSDNTSHRSADSIVGGETPYLLALTAALDSGTGRLNDIPDIETIFDKFARSREYVTFYKKALKQVADSPASTLSWNTGTAFTIFKNRNFLLAIQLLEDAPYNGAATPAPPLLATNPGNGLQSVISPDANLTISRYILPPDTDLSTFDPEARLQLLSVDKIGAFDPCYRHHAGEVCKIEREGIVCVLRLSEGSFTDFQWTFDSESLLPLFPNITLPSMGRFETAIDLVVEFSDDRIDTATSIDFLTEMLGHRLHFIRWKAIQGLGQLDGSLAMSALTRLLDDPHPHIRAAAAAASKHQHDSVRA